MKVLSYDTKNPIETKRTFQEEWAPHKRQTDMSFEWWYVTADLHDAEGNPYFAYVGMQDHNGAIMQNRLLHQTLPENMRSIALTATLSDYNNKKQKPVSPAGVAILPDTAIFDDDKNEIVLDGQTPDGKPYSIHWSYVEDKMHVFVDCPAYIFDFNLLNCNDGVWHKDSLGTEGMIQQGPENEFSFYYSLTNCPISGKIHLKDTEGNVTKTIEVFGSSWIDRQWGDFCTTYWEWSSFRFTNGARMHLYNFFNGHQEAFYRDVDGNVQYFDNVVVHQNGYCKADLANTWQSWGWSYDFPIEIEGSKHYTVKPRSNEEFLQFPDMDCEFEGGILHGFAIFEGIGELIDDETKEVVGVSVNESIDIRAMKNGPHDVNQK